MPLQNRVTPHGEIIAVSARGLFMGNRGVLYDSNRQLGRRRWAVKYWLICRLAFRGRQRTVMAPGRYTELFFLDEATAIGAGHRPCYECRRRDYEAWRRAFRDGNGLDGLPSAADMDRRMHADRIDPATRAQRRWTALLEDLPDGSFVDCGGIPHLVLGAYLLPWAPDGYGDPVVRTTGRNVVVLTPRCSVAALRAGYAAALHPSASHRL